MGRRERDTMDKKERMDDHRENQLNDEDHHVTMVAGEHEEKVEVW